VKFGGLDSQPDVELFYPFTQIPEPVSDAVIGSMAILVRTLEKPEGFAAAIREEVSILNKDIPVSSVKTMREIESNSVANRRFQMLLLSAFAAVALALAVVGIYGVVSYWVVQKTQEIASDMLQFIIARGMILSLAGVVLGLAGALFLTRLMTGLLFGVDTTDPLTFTAVAILLTSTALAACLIPAWRAMCVNPVVALRAD